MRTLEQLITESGNGMIIRRQGCGRKGCLVYLGLLTTAV